MADWILSVLRSGGHAGLAALASLECLFPPLPSELIFPLAGYLAQQGELTVAGCIMAGAIGGCAGSLPLFLIGRRLGRTRVEAFVSRHCRWTAVSPADVRRADQWFERHGAGAVVLAHVVPGLRSLIAFPAGVHRMPMWQFIVLTLVGTGVWASVLVGAGFVLRENFAGVERWLDPLTWGVLGSAAAMYVWRLWRQRTEGRIG